MKGGINRPTPAKPADVIRLEGKSHRTKKELRQRKQAEENLLTGKKLKEKAEVKNNEIAHREFLRLKKLLKEIGKDDDLYSGAINRYCLIFAECAEFEEQREKIFRRQQELEEKAGEIEFIEYITLQNDLSKMAISYDRQIQTKRKMLFDIEKENVMTIAAALRSIPKKPETKKNALREALNA